MKEIGFSISELETMSVGQALDSLEEYVESKSDNGKRGNTRRASQADFDAF
ncbi:hypothetical protein [Lacticaseibacillus pantheris]|uniref:hypothetical protein n=1 Tax=Lacticaseibacillus pantheris TaxID=171523 RepID=UPI00265985AC|nr:hypothetical protein [Lacticaseibacillus pantheris]WKF84492.1 hypothetical protein QY874_09390 [Lacticaseibacillus pantheris]